MCMFIFSAYVHIRTYIMFDSLCACIVSSMLLSPDPLQFVSVQKALR